MRPIDADALKEKIDSMWNGRPLSSLGARILVTIDEAPSIDICRCQDCKKSHIDGRDGDEQPLKGSKRLLKGKDEPQTERSACDTCHWYNSGIPCGVEPSVCKQEVKDEGQTERSE